MTDEGLTRAQVKIVKELKEDVERLTAEVKQLKAMNYAGDILLRQASEEKERLQAEIEELRNDR